MGTLGVAEQGKDIPFAIRRVFYLYGMKKGAVRGDHAHKAQEQFIICLSGSISLNTIDAEHEEHFTLSHPRQGVYLPAMTWVRVQAVSVPAIYMVAASGLYDEADYIRDYAVFKTLTGGA